MSSRESRLVVAALAALATLSAACTRSGPPPTELLLSVSSASRVDELELMVRDYGLVTDRLSVRLGGVDPTVAPYQVLVRPSSTLSGHLFLSVRGLLGGAAVAGAATYVDFTPGRRVEVRLVLDASFVDEDGDGFPSYASIPNCPADLCDCDDRRADVSPFRAEDCGDPADNNCEGGGNSDGCACSPDDPPVVCTNLPPSQYALAGVGACYLGALHCVQDPSTGATRMETECDAGSPTEEIPGNFIDDDCDGTVDEGSPCTAGAMRRCHLGFVDDDANPDPDERHGASKRLLGECAKPPPDWPAGVPFPVQRCEGGAWGACTGDREPQRAPPRHAGEKGFGWMELPSQCDGLDNDCDGLYDEEPGFDVDRDGYTVCGSVVSTPPHTEPGTSADFVDCDDTRADVHPGATEVCGNDVDEDCRCDHQDPAMSSPDIGLPGCRKPYSYLDCSVLPRSDAHPTGNCKDPPTWYHGFQTVAGTEACYACDAEFGKGCSPSGTCTTKAEDCAACPASSGWLASDVVEVRPLCTTAHPGTCTEDVAPIWDDVAGDDPYGDCGEVSCAGWHWGQLGGRCYDRLTQPADRVRCKAGRQCESAADLCPLETQRQLTPVDQAICTVATDANCVGVGTFVPDDQPAGQDLFDDCKASYDCATSDAQNGGGPFFWGITDASSDGEVNPLCYFRASVASAACNGHGGCQTRPEACEASGRGDAADGPYARPVCHEPDAGTCTGTSAPTYAKRVGAGEDPYGDCAPYACATDGSCQRAAGGTCSSSADCQTGSTCVDGVCCGSSTCGDCERCDVAGHLGTCWAITAADGRAGCSGPNTFCCNGVCVDPPGDPSELGGPCGVRGCAGVWECTTLGVPQCSRKGDPCTECGTETVYASTCNGDAFGETCDTLVAPEDCPACTICAFDAVSSAASCSVPYDQGATDTTGGSQCKDAQACGPGGVCLAGLGQACSQGSECASGNCVDSVCCSASSCGTCYACNVDGSGTCQPQTADQGTGCTGACDRCAAGSCVPRDVGDATECSACNACDSSQACVPIADGTSTSCSGAGQYCCGGACVTASGEWGAGCAGTGNDADCTGAWGCGGAGGASPTCVVESGKTCGYCSADGDTAYAGTCTGTTCVATATGCPACKDCSHASGTADCTGSHAQSQIDDTTPGLCQSGAECGLGSTGTNACACDGAGTCKYGANVACTLDTQCASGTCSQPAGKCL